MQLEVVSHKAKSKAHSTPLLFIHGAWHAAWCWEEFFLPYFAKHGYDSYALSLRGHGSSEGNSRLRWTRIKDYVADVAEVVKQFDTPPVLVGHSMGGMIVQKYLEKHQAPAAVLMASVPPKGALRTTLKIARCHPIAFLKTNLTLSLYPLIGLPSLAKELFFSTDTPEEKVRSYFARLQNESYLAFLDMLLFDLPQTKLIRSPILVLGAAKDNVFSCKEIEDTARAYNTRAEIFPDMAHDMMLESGWGSVADYVLQWLKDKNL